MRKNNKRALILSALSLLLCVSMLVGSTMAWFTDNASTAVNKIEAGTLDIDLLDKDNNSLDGESLNFVDEEGNVKTNILWEPGARYLLQDVTLVNKGSLAVKYKVMMNYTDDDPNDGVDLGDVIDVYIGDAKQGTLSALSKEDNVNESTLLSNGTAKYTGLKLVMQETAGNEYQGKSLSSIAVTVMAKQHTYETDSYNDQYDADAEYDKVVASADELKAALEAGQSVLLNSDVTMEDPIALSKSASINLNGNTLTLESDTANAITASNGATVDITGGKLKFDINDPSHGTTYDAIAVTNDTEGTTTEVNLNNVTIELSEPAVDWNDGGIRVAATAGEAVLNIGAGTVINTTRHLVFVVEDNATVNMTDGEININNFVNANGGTMCYGIDMAGPNATFNMTGGKLNVSADYYTNAFFVENDGVTLNISGGEVNASGFNTRVVEKYRNCNPTVNIAEGIVKLTDSAALYR